VAKHTAPCSERSGSAIPSDRAGGVAPLRIEEVATARDVLRLATKQRGAAVFVVLLGLASAVFESIGLSFLIPLAALATGEAIDLTVPVIGPLLGWLSGYVELQTAHVAMLVVTFFVFGIVVNYLNLVVSTILAMRFSHELRVRVFESTLSRPISLIESRPSGKFFNDLATEVWQVCEALFAIISAAVKTVTCCVFLGFLVMISPFYTMILIAMTGMMAIVIHLATRRVRGLGASAVAANEAFMAYIWDTLGGLRVIRGFGREAYERSRFAERSTHISDVYTRLRVLSGLVHPIGQIMTLLMVALILAIAVLRGDPLSMLLGFLAIAYRMQPRVNSLINARTTLRSLEASVQAVQESIGDRPEPTARGRHFAGLRRGITLERVSARYPNSERPALHDITCEFPNGQVTAVAGYSGAGKSTLVALLLRFIEPERGRILVDGISLADIQPETWHRRIAFVEQNAFLFNASIRENIGYGEPDADFEAICEAARVAQADSFIAALAKGYETQIGDDGMRLSQGQRQRIALARSLLRKPDVLILDEATNALDRPTERALRDAVNEARGERAVIVIAHRRETIETADRVIVIGQGRIIESGTPAELARAGGAYARLYLDDASAEPR
jgi:ATP-binding cassette, subfamily B, bacterial MsbA